MQPSRSRHFWGVDHSLAAVNHLFLIGWVGCKAPGGRRSLRALRMSRPDASVGPGPGRWRPSSPPSGARTAGSGVQTAFSRPDTASDNGGPVSGEPQRPFDGRKPTGRQGAAPLREGRGPHRPLAPLPRRPRPGPPPSRQPSVTPPRPPATGWATACPERTARRPRIKGPLGGPRTANSPRGQRPGIECPRPLPARSPPPKAPLRHRSPTLPRCVLHPTHPALASRFPWFRRASLGTAPPPPTQPPRRHAPPEATRASGTQGLPPGTESRRPGQPTAARDQQLAPRMLTASRSWRSMLK